MNNEEDLYALLQVHYLAEQEIIDAAYRRLARMYHPDVNPSEDATIRMKEVNHAYNVLSQPVTRAEYDRVQRDPKGKSSEPRSNQTEKNTPPRETGQRTSGTGTPPQKESEDLLPLGRFRLLASLRERSFRMFYIGILSGDFAIEMQVIVRGWFIYSITGSVFWLGIVTSSLGFSSFVVAPIGGLVADRFNKRAIVIAGQFGMALSMGLLGVSISTGIIEPWMLILGTAGLGVSLGLTSPARFAAVSQLVQPSNLLNAVSLSSSTRNVMRLIAPIIAGYLVRDLGADITYYSIAILHIIAAFILMRLPVLSAPGGHGSLSLGSATHDIFEGFQNVRADKILALLIVVAVLSNGLGMPINFLLPNFAKEVLQVGPEGLGLLTSAAGLGSIVGILFLAMLGDYQRKGRLLLIAVIGLGSSIILFASSSLFWLSLLLLVPLGMSQAAQMALNNTLLLSNAPLEVRGRVMSVYHMTGSSLSFVIVPLGALALITGTPILVISIGTMLLIAATLLALGTPLLRRLA
jgi:MFS family permease